MSHTCRYCEHREYRDKLAQALERGEYQEQPQRPRLDPTLRPMRDGKNRYTITGVATDVLTPTVWVKARAEWNAYHMELIPSSWYRKDTAGCLVLRDTENLDDDTVAEIEAHAGRGDVEHCPEETALMLGIDEHLSVPIDVIEINQDCETPGLPVFLDSLSFQDAARLLSTVPDLLRKCSCGTNED